MTEDSLFWQEVGSRIKNRRESLGVTQEALAKHLRITRTAILKIERGNRRVSTLELTRIA